MHLPDINVWLALTFDAHVHHESARAWFDGLPSSGSCCFCRMTQQGFLRLSTNEKVFGKHALSMTDAWKIYDTFLSDPRISFADEPVDLEKNWRDCTESNEKSPHVWNDGFLAAFAVASDLELVTFDRGFQAFPNLNCTIIE